MYPQSLGVSDVPSLRALTGPENISANTGMTCMLTILHPPLPVQASLIDPSTFVQRFQIYHLILMTVLMVVKTGIGHSRVPDLNACSCLRREALNHSPGESHPEDIPACRQKAREASIRSCSLIVNSQKPLLSTSLFLTSPIPTPQLFLPPPIPESQDIWASWGPLGWPRSDTV